MEKFKNIIFHPLTISLLIIVLGVGAVFALFKLSSNSNVESAVYVERSWGKQDSKVVITEYSDFQCPACQNFFQTVEGPLKTKYQDKIKFVYKHLPLTSIHPNAQRAAEASEAAGSQGKFWEYHDLLFTRQTAEATTWNTAKLTEYAKELGLDADKFKQELEDDKYRKVVRDSRDEATRAGYNSTPTVLINGNVIDSPSLEAIEAEIKSILGEASVTPTSAAKPTSTVVPTATPKQ